MILVVGASGELGGMIVRGAIEQGLPVRALVRSDTDATRLAALGAEPVFGDLKDPGSLAVACRGVGTVITTANTARRPAPEARHAILRADGFAVVEAQPLAQADAPGQPVGGDLVALGHLRLRAKLLVHAVGIKRPRRAAMLTFRTLCRLLAAPVALAASTTSA